MPRKVRCASVDTKRLERGVGTVICWTLAFWRVSVAGLGAGLGPDLEGRWDAPVSGGL